MNYLAGAPSDDATTGMMNGTDFATFTRLPSGFIRMNAATLAELQWSYCIKPLREKGLMALQQSGIALENEMRRRKADFYFHPASLIAAIAIPATTKVTESVLYASTLLQQATIACALEQYRIQHSHYPDTVEKLGALNTTDIWSGKPMSYALTSDGHYKLWSVGPDKVDDGGKRTLLPDHPTQTKFKDPSHKGDWVWDYPATK